MRRRRSWLDWVVVGIVVIGVAVAGVYLYQSYRESREKKDLQARARASFVTYANAVIKVRNSYIRACDKVWDAGGDEENYGLLNRVDPWADKLQRAAGALAAMEPPDEMADAHDALLGTWRKEVSFIRRHGVTANRIFDNEPYLYDFDAHFSWTERLTKEIDTTLGADKRVEAAWEKWKGAANAEGRRLGVAGAVD